MKNKKILFINGSSCGGAERMTILYAKILQKAGFECKLFIHIKPGEESKANIRNFIPNDMAYEEVVCRFRYYAFQLLAILHREKPNIVFCSMPLICRILAIIKFLHLSQAKLVFRCFNTPSLASKVLFNSLKRFFKHADIIIAQTQEMAEELVMLTKLKQNKVVTINNPIDKELILEKLKDAPFAYDSMFTNYLAAGSLSPRKNFCNLVKAFAIVHKQNRNSRLYIIGDDENKSEKNKIQQIIHANGLENNVFLEGFQANPFRYTMGCDCFVLSSDFEGLPNVMLEAMYLGRPVVATTCIPYIAQVVHEGQNGYTCPIRDPYALSEAMLKAKDIGNLPLFYDISHSEGKIIELFTKVVEQ